MGDFAKRRASFLANTEKPSASRRRGLTALTDEWVCDLAEAAGVSAIGAAVVAVGGYGRRELSPGSDLDLLLLVPTTANQKLIPQIADKLWYPIWDEGMKLDHSVRTIAEARNMAANDLKVALGLLDARTVFGDSSLCERLVSQVLADWRALGEKRLPDLREYVQDRVTRNGELPHLLEPDLKESFGGLREISILAGVAATGIAEVDQSRLAGASEFLLDVRDALHLVTGRPTDRLTLQEQSEVAKRLGIDSDDALLRRVSSAGRTISYVSDLTWHRIKLHSITARKGLLRKKVLISQLGDGSPLAPGVMVQSGEVVLAPSAQPVADPGLLLRLAAAAAQNGLRINPQTVQDLATSSAPMPTPWPREARESLVSLLGAGRLALPVWEALDQHDLFSRLIPEWSFVRSAPQHNPLHIFTVDRHLVETAINASTMTRRVSRPDLLLIGALFHDIGKAQDRDHTEVGVELMPGIAARLGFDEVETQILVNLVKHHLLLPDVATKRDPEDLATINYVAQQVVDHEFLELLHALTEADSKATGPAVSSEWRLALIADLVTRVHAVLRGDEVPPPPELDPKRLEVGADGDIEVVLDAVSSLPTITISAPDQTGLLAACAGLLALHQLSVRTATTQTVGDRAVSVWGVTPRFGELPDSTILAQDLSAILNGQLDISARLARRRVDMFGARFNYPPAQVLILEDVSARATVIEVRAHDFPGLLRVIARAISNVGVDIIAARVATLGSEAVDIFYVTEKSTGAHLTSDRAIEVKDSILSSLAAILRPDQPE
ncbi:MAG: [protein-PII] uridylyltransferase [Actinomycetales bacterium]|nr:[protein-PII] uridylyltransferase [Actinomycetales bacterium]